MVADAARCAPHRPGVYLFLDGRDRVAYVGKAVDLARRLASHARPRGHRVRGGLTTVERVVWDELESDAAAQGRELDLIAVLQPSKNKALRAYDRSLAKPAARKAPPPWPFLVLSPASPASGDTRLWRLQLCTTSDVTGSPYVFGCIPHLQTGVASTFVNDLVAGHLGLLRLLWAATNDATRTPYPGRITRGAVCADHTTKIDEHHVRPLRDLLGGTSTRLLDLLAAHVASDAVEPVLRPGLTRDLVSAQRFFEHGPARVRAMRRRHGLPAGPIAPATLAGLLRAEVAALVAGPSGADGYQRPR